MKVEEYEEANDGSTRLIRAYTLHPGEALAQPMTPEQVMETLKAHVRCMARGGKTVQGPIN